MIEKSVQIQNSMGLHARPSARFVKIAAKFPCEIFVTKDGMKVNGKSILGVMSLAAERGSEITIKAEGENEDMALDALVEYIFQLATEEKDENNREAD